MQRRKFLVGMGSLAAGASATIGTGALSESDIDRGVQGQVVADSGGYILVEPGGKNGQHVEQQGGEVTLVFEDNGDPAGRGLNADGTHYFDTIFNVRILDTDDLKPGSDYDMWITDTVPELSWYKNGNPNISIEGSSNSTTMSQLGGNGVPVGVAVDLDDSNLQAGDRLSKLFSSEDTFTIHVEASGGGSAPPSDN